METQGKSSKRGGYKAGALITASVGVLALPSAVMAFAANFRVDAPEVKTLNSLDPAASSESLTRAVAMRSLAKNETFPFTPAGTPNRYQRAVTVAVRVDTAGAKSIVVHGQRPQADAAGNRLHIAPAAFNLGVARGYQNFAQDLVPPADPKRGMAQLPDLKKFSLTPGTAAHDDSRFSTRLSIDEKKAPGRAPRTFTGDAGEVDLSGAYRVTDNLNVTAGVRYSQDRERLRPLTDGKQDSQSVYVGTQFRF